LRAQLLGIADEMTGPLGFAPSLHLSGGLDEQVPAEIAEQALHAVREALSNAARHAGASQVDVTVDTGSDLVVVVRDNGTGMKESTRRSGLANLAERARQLGGTLHAGPAADAGTELRWQVPLP
jgi:signal transduction histidine kinase